MQFTRIGARLISSHFAKQWASFLTLAVFCLFAPAQADPDFPKLTGRVVDDAGILSNTTKAQLTSALAAEEKTSGAQIVVVTLKSLRGIPIETFGYQLGRHWGIGQKGKNNGALFIVAPAEHRMRIEVGYGLEDKLTDLQSAVIIHDIVTPAFKAGHFDRGVIDGTNAILKVVGGGSVISEQPDRPDIQAAATFGVGVFILIGCMIVVICWPILLIFLFIRSAKQLHGAVTGRSSGSSSIGSSSHDSSDSDSSSSSSDDDFSGGGGDFGGGGASGSW